MDYDYDDAPTDVVSLGPCCICEGTEHVNHVLLLGRRGPMPGRGWGCIECGLDLDGAIAVICEACTAGRDPDDVVAAVRFVCRGYPHTDGRVPIAELSDEVFEHDKSRHPEMRGR
jgi:hypothetical protein